MATQIQPAGDLFRQFRTRAETTPGLLMVGLAAVWLLALTFFLVVFFGVNQHWAALKTVGKDATDSIKAAQAIKAFLTDMDASAANELLSPGGKNDEAVQGYQERRHQVTDNLLIAAGNITYPEEEDQIRTMLNQLGPYEQAIAQARLLHARKDKTAALGRYRDAEAIVNQQLIPAAEKLDKVNDDQLGILYAAGQRSAGWFLAGTVLAGLALLGTLVALQLFLYRHMHRVLNPGLLGASLVTAVFLTYVTIVFASVSHDLKVAKKDAFDSVHFLWRARAVAYDANGDESRWLLDPDRRDQYEKDFHDKVAKLVTVPPGMTYAQLVQEAERKNGDQLPKAFQGDLASELRNITFIGEKAAAVKALQLYGPYLELDRKIRDLERAGKHEEAVRLCTGTEEGESDWAFKQFDKALGTTLQINQDAFTDACKQGQARLRAPQYVGGAASLAVAVLALLGLWPRLREYSV